LIKKIFPFGNFNRNLHWEKNKPSKRKEEGLPALDAELGIVCPYKNIIKIKVKLRSFLDEFFAVIMDIC